MSRQAADSVLAQVRGRLLAARRADDEQDERVACNTPFSYRAPRPPRGSNRYRAADQCDCARLWLAGAVTTEFREWIPPRPRGLAAKD